MDADYNDENNDLSSQYHSLIDKISKLGIENDSASVNKVHFVKTTQKLNEVEEDSHSRSTSEEIVNGEEKDENEGEEEDEDGEEEEDDEEEEEGKSGYKKGGYHPVKIGDIYKSRYEVISKLGWGHFSTVWLANDLYAQPSQYVALKVVKSAPHYTEAALDEIELLQCVSSKDPAGKHFVVRLFDNFRHIGPNGEHIIMVFEVLGKNILHLIDIHYRGLPIPVVKSIVKQILIGLDFLHRECKIIHTDLKPENILLFEQENIKMLHKNNKNNNNNNNNNNNSNNNVYNYENVCVYDNNSVLVFSNNNNNNNHQNILNNSNGNEKLHPITMVKIADLGNACWVDKHFTDSIQTRQYRSPEAIIRYEYGSSVDIWSLGCIIFELVTGDLLFKPKKGENHTKSDDHLALILEVTNQKKFPKHMIADGKRSREYFNREGNLRHISNLKFWPLERVLIEKYKFTTEEAKEMSDFLLPMLRLDPDKRITAEEALNHDWLSGADLSISIPMTAEYSDSDSDSNSNSDEDEGDE